MIEDLAIRQVTGEEGEALADPLGRFFDSENLVVGDDLVVVNDAEACFALERDDPKPKPFVAEMVGG